MRYIFLGLLLCFQGLSHAEVLLDPSLTIFPVSGDKETNFRLDARFSFNSQGTGDGILYRFKPSRKHKISSWQIHPFFNFKPKDTGHFYAQVWVKTSDGLERKTAIPYRVRYSRANNQDVYIQAFKTLAPKSGEMTKLEAIIISSFEEDKRKSLVRWDFDSDGVWDTPLSESYIAYYGYSPQKTFSPSLQVQFPDGKTMTSKGITFLKKSENKRFILNRYKSKIHGPFPKPLSPVVKVLPGNEIDYEDGEFTFDASVTRVDGWMEWSVNGAHIASGKKIFKHRFRSPGEHKVQVRNCIYRKNPVCSESTIPIKVNSKVLDTVLNFNITNITSYRSYYYHNDWYESTVGDNLRFNAFFIQNRGENFHWQYRWDFDSDGVWDTSFSSNSQAQKIFHHKGVYFVTLQAQYSKRGQIHNVEKKKKIIIKANALPRGIIKVKEKSNDELYYVGELVPFHALKGDRNNPLDILEIRTDSDGDGIWDNIFNHASAWWWRYTEPGKYKVIMQVRDPQKKVSQTHTFIEILPFPEIKGLVSVSHRTQVINSPVIFNASDSKGVNLSYKWEVLGRPDLSRGGSSTSIVFDSLGKKKVKLSIIDSFGNSKSIFIPVLIVNNNFSDKENLQKRNLEVQLLKRKTEITEDLFRIEDDSEEKNSPLKNGMRPGF